MRDLPIAARLYVAAVVVAGALLVVLHARDLPLDQWWVVLPLAALTAFARMPCRAHSTASVRVRARTPALAEAEWTTPGPAPHA